MYYLIIAGFVKGQNSNILFKIGLNVPIYYEKQSFLIEALSFLSQLYC